MYLRGSKWSTIKNQKRSSPFRIFLLLLLVAGAIYVNQVIIPTTPPLFVPTPTFTRSPETYIFEADELIRKGKIYQAIETYKKAVKAAPRNPALYVTLARWQTLYGDYEGAMENIQNALLLNPNLVEAHAVNGWLLGQKNEYLQAEAELINQALERDPKSALAWAYLAEIYVHQIQDNKGDLNTQQKAIDASQNAVKYDGSLMETHRARGMVLEITTQHEQAIAEYEAAAEIYPNLADLYISLGREYRLVDNYPQSEEVLMKAISLRPDDPAPYAELTATYLKAGDYSKGIQIAEQAVQKKPEDPFLQGLLGTMYFKDKRWDEAVIPLRLSARGGMTANGKKVEPLPLDPEDPTSIAFFSRFGLALANVGNCGEALQVSRELLQVIQNDEIATGNANEMVELCRKQLEYPSPTASDGIKVIKTSQP